MEETKAWYESKGVWGGLIAMLASICAMLFGVKIDQGTQQQMVNSLVVIAPNAVALIGAILAIYGRIKANSKIGGKK